MICQFCKFPIPSLVPLLPEEGRRVQGVFCTNCEARSIVMEVVVKPPKWSPLELAAHQNRNT